MNDSSTASTRQTSECRTPDRQAGEPQQAPTMIAMVIVVLRFGSRMIRTQMITATGSGISSS